MLGDNVLGGGGIKHSLVILVYFLLYIGGWVIYIIEGT